MKLLVALSVSVLLAATAFAQAPPALTPLESATYEMVALKAQLVAALERESALRAELGACQGRLGPLEAERNRAALAADIAQMSGSFEQARPGWKFDPQTKTFAPAPPPAAPPPAAPNPKG